MSKNPYKHLSSYDEKSKDLNVIIETPKGSRNKYAYDVKQGIFKLSTVLPAGSTFPYDFGYIPSTEGQDGDPLDVLVLMDERVFPGCLITARLIGVIRGEQTKDGKTVRNDRLIAVATHSHDQQDIESIDQINPHLIEEIEQFFVSYHALAGSKFAPKGCLGPDKAAKLVQTGMLDKSQFPAEESKAKRKSGNKSKVNM